MDEDAPKKMPEIRLGEDIATLSVDELAKRILALEAEIARCKSAIEARRQTRSAAENFFKR